MYTRNAESPSPITVGQVVQISDGAVQTADVSARVKTGSGAWEAAAGTLACDATSGQWTYTPTQGETNAETFSVAVYKADCLGSAVTVTTDTGDAYAHLVANLGTNGANATEAGGTGDQLTDVLAAITNTGTGPYACTWTVEYDGTPLAGAVVAFWLAGVLKGRGTTDANGQVSMSLAAGVYTVAIDVDGYVHTPEAHEVTSTEATWTETFDALTPTGTVPSPASDLQCTGYGYVYDEDGNIESGAEVITRLIAEPSGSGLVCDKAERTEVSAVDGLVTFVQLWIGGTYEFRRSGSTVRKRVTIETADVAGDGTYALPNFLG